MATNPISREERLLEFQLTEAQETGVEIGRGYYAAVVELQFRGLKCAGKRLYTLISMVVLVCCRDLKKSVRFWGKLDTPVYRRVGLSGACT